MDGTYFVFLQSYMTNEYNNEIIRLIHLSLQQISFYLPTIKGTFDLKQNQPLSLKAETGGKVLWQDFNVSFPQSLLENTEEKFQIRPRSLTSLYFPLLCSLIMLAFYILFSEGVISSSNKPKINEINECGWKMRQTTVVWCLGVWASETMLMNR